VLAAVGCGGGDGNVASGPATAITGVAVVDVEHGLVLPDQTVVIVGDRIEEIGHDPTSPLPPARGRSTVAGRT